MIDFATFLTLALMAVATYITRIAGYLALRGRKLGPRMTYVLDAVPGCVLISVIAPHFVSDRLSDLLGLAVAVLLAARAPLLVTVLGSMAATALFRHLLP